MQFNGNTQHAHDNTSDTQHTRTSFCSVVFVKIHDELLMAVGDESGEGASETAATSNEGSRRAHCPTSQRAASVRLCCCRHADMSWSSCSAHHTSNAVHTVNQGNMQVETLNLHVAFVLRKTLLCLIKTRLLSAVLHAPYTLKILFLGLHTRNWVC